MKFNFKNFESSPQLYARIAGILYLVIILMGIGAEALVRNKLFVSGDANATANNIMHADFLWKMGITADLIMHICDLHVMIILYYLLNPVSKKLALLNLSFNFNSSSSDKFSTSSFTFSLLISNRILIASISGGI